jgi:hypothetical protein
MSRARLLVSALAAAVFLFVSGGLLYGWLIAAAYRVMMGHLVRSPEDLRLGIVVLEKLVQGGLLAWAVSRLSGSRWSQSLGLGALIAAPFALSLFGNFPVDWATAVELGLIDFARVAIAVQLIAWVQRVMPLSEGSR